MRKATLAGLLAFTLLWGAGLVGWQTATAQSKSVAFELGSAPDSYSISGEGFEPGVRIDVVEVPCGGLPCAAEGMAAVRGVLVEPDGSFQVFLQASPAFEPLDGRSYRLIVVVEPGVSLGAAGSPSVQVPLHHSGVPGPPAVGNSEPRTSNDGHQALAASLICAGAVLLVATTWRLRTRARQAG